MEFLLAGVFLCAGLGKIFSYNRKPSEPGNEETSGLMGLPYTWRLSLAFLKRWPPWP